MMATIMTTISIMMMMMMTSKVDTAFKMFDKNRDGFITKEEFAQV